MTRNHPNNWTYGVGVVALMIIILTTVAIGYGFIRLPANPSQALPLLAIAGVMSLFAMLALVSSVFSAIGLSKPEFALGLPEGSVRAVIALSLIVIFVIYGVHLFSAIDGNTILSRGLSPEQAQQMLESMEDRIISLRCRETGSKATCDVLLYVESSPESKDLAKQIVTTLATLVAAVSSFYFGSRTASDKSSETKPASAPPTAKSVSPPYLSTDTKSIVVAGTNLDQTVRVKLEKGGEEISGFNILATSTTLSCTFDITSGHAKGEWNLTIVDSIGNRSTLANAVKIN